LTDLAALTVTVQLVPETESHPVQPLKTERKSGATLSVTTVSKSKRTEQVEPQLIWLGLAGLDVEVTVPFPLSKTLDLVTVSENLCRVKVAVTDLAALMVTVQEVPATVSHPSQRLKLDPVAGAAVSVTAVPTGYVPEQTLPQLMGGVELELTVPPPFPVFFTSSVAVTVKLVVLVPVP
jgi:hypothetical protein